MKQNYLGQVNMSLMLFVEQVLTTLSLTVAEKGEQGLRDATSRVSPGPRRAFVCSGVSTAAQYLTDSNNCPAYLRAFLIRTVRFRLSLFRMKSKFTTYSACWFCATRVHSVDCDIVSMRRIVCWPLSYSTAGISFRFYILRATSADSQDTVLKSACGVRRQTRPIRRCSQR